MADCPISLEKVESTNPPKVTWRIAPFPFNLEGLCTVKVTADNIPVTGTGQYGDIRITGWTAINGTVVLEPPPTKGKIVWNVTCPNCTSELSQEFAPPPPFKCPRLKLILNAIGQVFKKKGA